MYDAMPSPMTVGSIPCQVVARVGALAVPRYGAKEEEDGAMRTSGSRVKLERQAQPGEPVPTAC